MAEGDPVERLGQIIRTMRQVYDAQLSEFDCGLEDEDAALVAGLQSDANTLLSTLRARPSREEVVEGIGQEFDKWKKRNGNRAHCSIQFIDQLADFFLALLSPTEGQEGDLGASRDHAHAAGVKLEALTLETAPRDDTMVRLLVVYEDRDAHDYPLNDDDWDRPEGAWTIGFNGFDHHGEDEWIICGWDMSQDRWTYGRGRIIGWLPYEAALSSQTQVVGDKSRDDLKTPSPPPASGGEEPVVYGLLNPDTGNVMLQVFRRKDAADAAARRLTNNYRKLVVFPLYLNAAPQPQPERRSRCRVCGGEPVLGDICSLQCAAAPQPQPAGDA